MLNNSILPLSNIIHWVDGTLTKTLARVLNTLARLPKTLKTLARLLKTLARVLDQYQSVSNTIARYGQVVVVVT